MEEISHKGKVVSIGQYVTDVEIVRTSACTSCIARRSCGFAEEEKKVVPVPTQAGLCLSVGDEVDLRMKSSMGLKAVWLSYVLPLAVLIVAVLVAYLCGAGELFSGLTALGAVAVYYLLLFCFRNKLKNEFVFYIKW